MKTFTHGLAVTLLIVMATLFSPVAKGQSILNPADTVITYNAASPPTQPAWGTIGKWVRTKRVSWNTNNWKCYIYNGQCFRLRFPKSYNPTANDGKKYPILIFFHGDGEGGPVTDNEYQLFHGGNVFDTAVSGSSFDGYVFCMQTTNGFWGEPVYGYIQSILDYMITNNKLDPFRVNLNGLSAGGEGTWQMAYGHTPYIAGAIPMSNADLSYKADTTILKFTPLWLVQGGLDGAPDPGTAANVVASYQSAGANLTYTLFPNDGHDTWDDTWKQPNFWPFCRNTYESNPWTLFGHNQFCPGATISATLGLPPGLQAYQWRMNGTVIPTATSNSLQVTQLGTYDARIERNGIWSDWSHTPVVVSIMQPTVTPNITIAPLTSNVIPALDTSKGVTMQVPTGYASYVWKAVGGTTTLSSTNTLYTRTPGSYTVQVTQQFGCSSSPSAPYPVINAAGANGPSAVGSLQVTPISQTALRLDWTVDPGQAHPQTGFEVYEGSQSGGPYKIVALLGAGALNDTVSGLLPGGKYYFVVRAVNANAGSPTSNEVNGTTIADVQPPTAPGNLTITGTTRSTVGLSWTASTDNVGVTSYDIYVNGVKQYSTTGTTFSVDNLQYPTSYAFSVTARDFAKNISPFSNQVTAEPLGSGLTYKFYTYTTAPTALTDYGNQLAVKTGIATTGISLSPATTSRNYGFLWEGFLHVTAAGNYVLRTTSVDGSDVYLGPLNGLSTPYAFGSTPIINNDGVHTSKTVTSATLALQVGVYPIAIAYFHGSSGSGSIALQWTTPSSGTFATIPSSAFLDVTVVGGQPPAAPSNILATALAYNKIGLTWTDNSTNETGFEVWRSTSATTGYTTIGTVGTGVTSYIDSTLSANTKYYYELRAINQYGSSSFATNYTEAYWQFNNNYNDSTGNGRTLTALNSPVFDGTTKQEGSASVKLNGTTQALTIPNTGSFAQTAFSQRTIAGWINSSSNTGNRVIFDFGGSDNGLSLQLGTNTLVAGVASANSRATISAPFTTTGAWTHVAVVYLGDTLQLYVNGVLVASNNALAFHSIATTTNGSRIGQINGTIASNTSGTGLFSGWIDAFGVYNTAFDVDVVNALMNATYQQSFATTQSLPTTPAAPTNLVAQGTSTPTTVTINWTDNATNETSYQVYRSAVNNTNFLLRATLPANSVSYKDTGLFTNSVYYYEVRAVNSGGNSAFSNADSAHTKDNLPTVTAIASQFMRYGTQLVLNVSASDVDAETLTVTTSNMPSFGVYTSTGNGTGTITFNPAQADQNTYNAITVTVTDQHGGSVSTSFNLVVNNNYNPVITRPVPNVSVNEKQTATVNLAATDQNAGDVLTWSFTGLPGFAAKTTNGGSATLTLTPGYTDGGSYPVQARVDDGNQGFDTVTFTITVVPVPLPTVNTYVHFDGLTGTTAASPWNNTAAQPAQNVAFPNLLDQTGANSGVTLTITTPWQSISYGDGTNVLGQTTGNNSGVYPDLVLNSGYFTDGTPQNISVSGLDTSTKYNFTFFGTRGGVNDDRTTIYSVSGTYVNQSVSLQCASNTANTVSVSNVRPNADGTVTLTLAKGANAPFGYLNALVITKQYNDHTAPAAPRNLTGTIVNNSSLSLTWVAAAYNANSYQVYRSLNQAGPYTLLNPGATNPTQASYVDTGLSQNNTYYYYATATNNYGVSAGSDTFMVVVPNLAPSLSAAVSGITAPVGQTTTVTVTATDAPTDVITLAVSGLPAFASFVDNGNGTGVLTLKPGAADIGSFSGTLTATDNHGAVSSTPVTGTVALANLRNVYINMNDGSASEPAQGAPWNNMNSAPNAGAAIAHLVDDQGTTTNFGINLGDTWAGSNNVGPTTGNNSGVYPDNVMQSLYYDDGGATKHINLTGLSPNAKYNVIFYAGRAGVTDDRIMFYNIGNDTVSLNAASNTSKTVEIDGVSPDATGKIVCSMWKDGGAAFEYINAMQLEYTYDTTFSSPAPLSAISPNASTIQLVWANNAPAITTGFEVWRGTTPTGPFTLQTTVGGTVTTYTDGGLSAGTSFFYEVRALAGTRQSAFSNIAGGSTVAYTVKIQFNDGADNLAQGGTWNSTNTLITPGFVLPNLINTQSRPTGMNLTVINNFEAYNDFGAVTGNNSGIFPDNVMNGFFYNDYGITATLAVTGLNLTSTYNFNFFGSRANPATLVTSTYQIGNQIVTQDATNNTSSTVQIAGVRPDSTGTIYFSVYSQVVGRSYLNALTIDGVPDPTSNFGQTPVATQTITNGAVTATSTRFSDSAAEAELTTDTKAVAFPDPFVDAVSLSLHLPQQVGKLMVSLVDVQGRVLYRQQFENLPQGTSVLPLGITGSKLPAGSYYLLLQGLPDGKNRTLPLLKMQR